MKRSTLWINSTAPSSPSDKTAAGSAPGRFAIHVSRLSQGYGAFERSARPGASLLHERLDPTVKPVVHVVARRGGWIGQTVDHWRNGIAGHRPSGWRPAALCRRL